MSVPLTNQMVKEYFDKAYGKYFLTSTLLENVEDSGDFRNAFYNGDVPAKFGVELDNDHFNTAVVEIKPFDRQFWVATFTTTVSIKPPRVYPIPVGFCGKKYSPKYAPSFFPLIGPFDRNIIKGEVWEIWFTHWFYYKMLFGGALDILSLTLNKNLRPKRFRGTFSTTLISQAGNMKATFGMPNCVIIAPNANVPGEVSISLIELGFFKINKKKTIFNHRFNFKKTFLALSQLADTYNAFMKEFDPTDYPKDPYLNGFEAFICNKCGSMTVPDTLQAFGGFIMKSNIFVRGALRFIPPCTGGKTMCPSCGSKGRFLAFLDNNETLDVACETIFRCKDDLTPLEIIKTKG